LSERYKLSPRHDTAAEEEMMGPILAGIIEAAKRIAEQEGEDCFYCQSKLVGPGKAGASGGV
jgi:hypothetical protein